MGSICSFTCPPSLELVGDEQTQCQKNGEWSHPTPICQRKYFYKANTYIFRINYCSLVLLAYFHLIFFNCSNFGKKVLLPCEKRQQNGLGEMHFWSSTNRSNIISIGNAKLAGAPNSSCPALLTSSKPQPGPSS